MTQPNVFVTGGGRGIGRAIALRFAREGANVVVAARSSDQLDAVVAEIDAAGGKGLAAQMNLRDHGSIEAAVYRALEEFDGTLDVLVNNAGIFGMQSIDDLDLKTWSRFIEVNVTGALLVTQEALAGVRESERGHIFNISSTAGQQGFAGNVAYCTSKYALRGFSDGLREDLRESNVRVSTVYPGATDTAIFDGVPGDWDRSTMNKPEDVAEAIWTAYQADSESDDIQIAAP